MEDLLLGTGTMAEPGTRVTVHYTGRLRKGDTFRSTHDDGTPISFVIGRREVVAGLERGVVGMRVGGRRVVRVPPHLGYGPRSVPGIPGNAILLFEVELLDVAPNRVGAQVRHGEDDPDAD
jgi:FKBP-type peptidyl-prolyl cis-trans isomerase